MPGPKKRFSRGETPIERIFRKVMGRKMNEAERHYLPVQSGSIGRGFRSGKARESGHLSQRRRQPCQPVTFRALLAFRTAALTAPIVVQRARGPGKIKI